MVEAQLEDLAPAWFVIDTGSGNTVDFHVPYVKSNDLLRRYPRQSERLIGGVGGSLTATVAVSSSFTLAGHTFRSVPVTLATADQGAFASGTSAGTIGAELLSRFVVTFDLPHERLFLQPGVALDAPFQKDRLGISCKDQDGHLVVEFIAPGSPAAAAGMVAGEELVAIDGVALEGRPLRDRLRQVAHEAAGRSVRIGLRGGTERVVKLADYF
jgi:membrane-associated protease RseP (regulator of RpoE activity)